MKIIEHLIGDKELTIKEAHIECNKLSNLGNWIIPEAKMLLDYLQCSDSIQIKPKQRFWTNTFTIITEGVEFNSYRAHLICQLGVDPKSITRYYFVANNTPIINDLQLGVFQCMALSTSYDVELEKCFPIYLKAE